MDVLIDWEDIPWNEPEDGPEPGYRDKTCTRDGQEVWLCEFSEGYADDGWCTEGHLFHVLTGESTLRLRDGNRSVRLQPGDTGILLAGEDAHKVDPAAGDRIQILVFERT